MNGTCQVCGKENIYCEIHHIIKRSQASYMKQIKVNLIQLCQEDHRGTLGVHNNKRLDLQLKVQLQFQLQKMFTEKYYSRDEIQEILQCTDFDTTLILKKLTLYRYGYNTEQLVMRLLGGRLYD